MANSHLPQKAYAIGIICALFEEKAAVEAMLDERHEALGQKPGDTNSYTFGKIGKHNVVVACLPGGHQGKAAAASVAKDMTRSFPIKLGLMVGIGGGVPSQVPDIRLGDVVVSLPKDTHGGVIQYDLGKMESDGFRRKGHLDKPPKALLSAVTSLRTKHELEEPDFPGYLSAISRKPRMAKKYGFQGSDNDQLFGKDNQPVIRDPREDDLPRVFYGTIGSGDLVMKDGEYRDLKAADDKIICFEMEAAGLLNDFPCLVIRGISDYADARKNDRWQPYAAATAAAYAKELLSAVSVQEVEELGPARKHSVPFSLKGLPAIDHFVQRNEDMRKLEDFFFSQTSQPVQRRKFVVHGLGGIGKTQLCVEFARKHQARYTAILWMDGSSENALQKSFDNVFDMLPAKEMPADLVRAFERRKAKPEDIVQGVLDWLSRSSNQKWLHIIDNLDHDIKTEPNNSLAYSLENYSAQVDHGSLLITSRVSTLTMPQNSLQLTGMTDDEACALLEAHFGKIRMTNIMENESHELEVFLRRLEGMPLALDQAGAFIGQTNTSLSLYLGFYDNTWTELIQTQDEFLLEGYAEKGQRSILTTWMISYKQVEDQSQEAATLLKLWAYFDRKDIWYELIACANRMGPKINLPEWLSILLAKDRLKFQVALGLLKRYSLVNNGTENDSYSMHAVLHSWCRHLASMSSVSEAFPELAANIVTRMMPHAAVKGFGALQRRLFPHGQQLLYQLRFGTAWKASHVLPKVYGRLAKLFAYNQAYEEAAEVLERALEEREKIYGKDHPKTMNIATLLAHSYTRTDKYAEVQRLAERALAVYERLLTSDPHPSESVSEPMIQTLVCLGWSYGRQGRLVDAEDMYKRARAIASSEQHQRHGKVLSAMVIMDGLGNVHARQGRLTEAELMLKRALEVSSKIFGPDHYFTLTILSRISGLYYKLGKVVEGKAMVERAAAGFEKITLEDYHPPGVIAREKIKLFEIEGKLAEALELAEQVLTEKEERLGSEHRDTLRAAFRLGEFYARGNRLPEAKALYARFLSKLEERLGPEHPYTLDAIYRLARLHYQDKRMQEARTLCEQLMPIIENTICLGDLITSDVMELLAYIYINMYMLSDAEQLFKRVLTHREQSLGSDHSETLSAVRDLGCIYRKQGYKDREVEMSRRAFLGYKNTLGPEHEYTLDAAQLLRQALGGTPGEFSLTSQNIMLDGEFNLIASCQRVDGSWLRTSISLNDILENQEGRFAWARRGNFVTTARSIRLSNIGIFLVAELVDEHGVWRTTRVDLDERIANHDGKLTFVEADHESAPATSSVSQEQPDGLGQLPAETTSLTRVGISAKSPKRRWWRRIGGNNLG